MNDEEKKKGETNEENERKKIERGEEANAIVDLISPRRPITDEVYWIDTRPE